MKIFSSLDQKDRRMLFAILGLVVALVAVFAVFTPPEDPNSNPVPDSYHVGRHGAKAAYTLLQRTGYLVERWQQPLSELADQASPGTVLILAAPGSVEKQDRTAIATILKKGGRVLATDFRGGELLPGNEVDVSNRVSFAACEAQPEGLQPLSAAGTIWVVPSATWGMRNPRVRTAFTCSGRPVVVEYPVGTGTAIWWASSTPLENGSIERGHNLELLLASVGPAGGKHVYWDESLHNARPTQWSYVKGPVWPFLLWGSAGLGVLTIFSFSRRRGPVRALPQIARTTPVEFLDALGGLYRSTGAASTVTLIAWERFRTQALQLAGLGGFSKSPGKTVAQFNAHEVAAALGRRFGDVARTMEADLIAAEEASGDDKLKPRRALRLVQALRRHEKTLRTLSSHAGAASTSGQGLHSTVSSRNKPSVTLPGPESA